MTAILGAGLAVGGAMALIGALMSRTEPQRMLMVQRRRVQFQHWAWSPAGQHGEGGHPDNDLDQLRAAPVSSLVKIQTADGRGWAWFSHQGWHCVHTEFGGYHTMRRDFAQPIADQDGHAIPEPPPPRFQVVILDS
jgi:hypothetical protein